MKKKILSIFLISVFFLSLTSCGKNKKVEVKYENSEINVTVGDVIEVVPEVTVGKKVKDFALTYSVSDDTLATVDSDGKFTALKEGTVYVYAKGNDKKETSATLKVIINSPSNYTVSFDTDGGSVIAPVTVNAGSTVSKPTDPTKAGYTFNGWKLNGAAYNFETAVTSNIILVASWQALKYYTVTFDSNGGTPVENASVLEGTPVSKPTDPTKENHVFLGWATIYGEYNFETAVKKNLYLTALWEYIGPEIYTITYNLNGGTMTNEVKEYTEEDEVTLSIPVREGYKFIGWYESSIFDSYPIDKFSLGTTGNKVLYARWVEEATSTHARLAFNLNGGIINYYSTREAMVQLFVKDFKEYFKNTTYSSKTNNIASDGSTFFSYSYAKDGKALGHMFLTSAEYNAKWGWVLTQINDARRYAGKTALTAGDSQSESRGEIQAWINGTNGYVMDDGSKYGSNYEVDAPHNNWKAYVTTYLTSLDSYSKVALGDTFLSQLPTLERAGYTLEGWYTSSDYNASSKVTDATTISDSTLLYVKWDAIKYNITYELNGGINDANAKDTFSSDDIITLLNPTCDGWDFAGWYTTPTFDEGTKVLTTFGFTDDLVLYAMWEKHIANVTFDFDGGVTQDLYDEKGTAESSLFVNNYNSNDGGYLDTAGECIFINSGEFIYGNPVNAYRIYIALDPVTSLYKVIGVNLAGKDFPIPSKTEYSIIISSKYYGEDADNFNYDIKPGTVVSFIGNIKEASINNPIKVVFNNKTVEDDNLLIDIKTSSKIVVPTKFGYSFDGWYDEAGNRYTQASDFTADIIVTAKWTFEDKIVGSFSTNSWVVVGDEIELSASYSSDTPCDIEWSVNDSTLASVNEGVVTGLSEGVVEVYATDPNRPETKFTFYVTVLSEAPTGIVKLLTDSNNATIYTRDDLIIGGLNGSPKEYYTKVTESVSKILFEEYVLHSDYLMTSITNAKSYGTFESIGQTVEFITFHYAADMNGAKDTGGADLAQYGANPAYEVSFHFGVGNDGVWASLPEAYAGYHAGTGKSTTNWVASGVMVEATDPEFAVTTLGNDGYFYINGRRTTQQNTTDGKILSEMGFAYKVVNGEYYMTNMRYDSTYQRICSGGGNYNTIGIESSVAIDSDLWLTWQYSAQLIARLLDKYNLPLTQLVGHNFWSGKWCPQPMLEYDLEIWHIFVQYVKQELAYLQNYNNYNLNFSSTSEYLGSNGRITALPEYSKCVTYDVTYTDGTTTKTITLSSIVPGTIA